MELVLEVCNSIICPIESSFPEGASQRAKRQVGTFPRAEFGFATHEVHTIVFHNVQLTNHLIPNVYLMHYIRRVANCNCNSLATIKLRRLDIARKPSSDFSHSYNSNTRPLKWWKRQSMWFYWRVFSSLLTEQDTSLL